jgi:TonB family protein
MKNVIKIIVIFILLNGIARSQNDSTKNAQIPAKQVYTYVEQMPSFPGYDQGMTNYLSTNLKYPMEAQKKSIEGRVYVSFVVNEDGKVSDVTILRGIGGGCDQEAKRVVERMPNWNPGKQNGRAVAVKYNLPIQFKIQEETASSDKDAKTAANKIEIMPEFPGGAEGLQKYLIDKINYPKASRKNNIEGKVIVSFVVNEKGKTENIIVKKGLDKDCDKEAVRVVKKMPKWKPGMDGGKPVKVQFNLPINFKLQ